ncbi:hypothetical protein K438DRAFT_1761854 [Mycena galopus ATCC 62051]|nr:hypothetical protein K438DRAFT_1761854 [Mycena galopus ATCC 62051]
MIGTPTLPRELEKIIFEIAALKHPLSMPSMVRVTQRVKIWIEPQLYKVLMIDIAPMRHTYTQCIVIRSLRTAQKLIASGSRRAPMLREHTVALKILSLCRSTINLVIDNSHNGQEFLPVFANIPLQRLAVGAWSLVMFHLTFAHPAFAHITHLHVCGSDAHWIQNHYLWSSLAYPPRLTHLSFTENCVMVYGCHAVLQRCASLEVLVWLLCERRPSTPWSSHNAPSLPVGSDITDPRFIQLTMPDYWADWERGARGFHDYWVKAEIIIAQRRANIT